MLVNVIGRVSGRTTRFSISQACRHAQHSQYKLPELSDERSQCVPRLHTRHYAVDVVPQVADIRS
jgi:hypothetical protein